MELDIHEFASDPRTPDLESATGAAGWVSVVTLPPKQTFELFVDDDRYAVPTLHLIFAWSGVAALEIADGVLRESAHHLGAELRQGGEKLAGLGSFATLRATPPPRMASDGAGA